jgi:rhamnulokinase
VPAHEIYSLTGIQFLPFNTLYQVLANAENSELGNAELLLPIADYFNYRFSNRQASEISLASTTQLMDVNEGQWSRQLLEKLGLAPTMWPEIVESGTRLGPALLDPRVEVLATCSHDTASAVAAAPATDSATSWSYISCGTWSLMGVERPAPLLSEEAREAGFTNEAGLDGTIRFLKNLTGLWVLQECMREWRESGQIEWADLELAARAELRSGACSSASRNIDLDDPLFLPRGPMEERIHTYCGDHGPGKLESRGEIVLAILSSIAESYRRTLVELERVTGSTYDRIHLFGGGSQNSLLCELTADTCRREVVAGPVEATAMGNLLIQARTMGDLSAGMTVRDVSAASSELRVYLPRSD